MHIAIRIITFALMSAVCCGALAQNVSTAAAAEMQRRNSRSAATDIVRENGEASLPSVAPASALVTAPGPAISVADSLLNDSAAVVNAGIIEIEPIPLYYKLPAVYDDYHFFDADSLPVGVKSNPGADWLDRVNYVYSLMDRIKQKYMIDSPETVSYNVRWLPEPPKKFEAVIDPSSQKIDIREVKVNPDSGENIVAPEVQRKNWIHNFTGNVQFSQAFISPNWYQGGNNNLNMIAHAVWNVKLNQAYHPKLLFESTVQYKLGINSAPDDSLRSYSISEDLFQINSTFGVKAARRWFYSATFQFKTQLLNSYTKNTNNLRSAFLSPAELTVGLGMTYNYVNPRKTLQFDASISPLSYNLKICTKPDHKLSHSQFDISPNRHTVSQYGSTAELKLSWKLAYNITWQSRFFMFTDYEYAQADWENTFSFSINQFLSTQIYLHARYDSQRVYHNPDWHKLQLKEILSFGFSYRFATI